APSVAVEKSLLGIRILQSYKDVFRKYGQPNRVYRVDEMVDLVEATDSQGRLTGGIRGLGDEMQSAGNTNPFAGRAPGTPGGFPGMPGAMARPGGLPGFPGAAAPGFPGGMPGTAMASNNANNPNVNQDTFASAGGYIWVYFFPKKELVYEFIFNADNRVEII